MAQQPIRWGILGPGSIANNLAKGVQALPDATVQAVGSRDMARATEFAGKYGIPSAYGSYEELVSDPNVDIVYVSTPHPFHAPCSLLALRAGKPVMCEKPFTINRGEAATMVAEARARNLFLMEAMWSRFFPLMARIRETISSGAIGELLLLQADFGFRAGFNPSSRLFAPELGGGGLLDVGVYPISLAHMLLGVPDQVSGVATLGATGVDEAAAISLRFPSGAVAALTTGVRVNTPQVATLIGSAGSITIHAPWWVPERATIKRGSATEEITEPKIATGFEYQAAEAGRCLREGLIESPILNHEDSLAVMQTMDTLRAQWGVRYPMEAAQ